MAKILISSLGAGVINEKNVREQKYKDAVYQFANSKEYKTSFFAAALCEFLNIDKIILIGTQKSMWDGAYEYFQSKSSQEVDINYFCFLGDKIESKNEGNNIIEEDLTPLCEAMDRFLQMKGSAQMSGSQCKIIEYGLNEEQLQKNLSIFMEIGESLNAGDEVYLDITHSFRSIPFFMYMMVDFIRHLRIKEDIKIAGIYYGMLDAQSDSGVAPIVDLSSLYDIAEWTKAASNFINYGNGYQMAELIDDSRLTNLLKNISDLVNLNNIRDLKREIDKLNSYFNELGDENNVYFRYLEPHVQQFIKRFRGISTEAEFQFKLAEWHFENKRYANGYICLVESVISQMLFIYKRAGQDVDVRNFTHRESIKHLLINNNYRHFIDGEISDTFKKIIKIRNNIAHAGFKDENNFQEQIKMVNTFMKQIKKWFFQPRSMENIPKNIPFQQLVHEWKNYNKRR